MADLVLLRTCSTRVEADLIRTLLADHGIPCVVQADDAGGMRPYMNVGVSVSLKVNPAQLDAALELLKALEEAPVVE